MHHSEILYVSRIKISRIKSCELVINTSKASNFSFRILCNLHNFFLWILQQIGQSVNFPYAYTGFCCLLSLFECRLTDAKWKANVGKSTSPITLQCTVE